MVRRYIYICPRMSTSTTTSWPLSRPHAPSPSRTAYELLCKGNSPCAVAMCCGLLPRMPRKCTNRHCTAHFVLHKGTSLIIQHLYRLLIGTKVAIPALRFVLRSLSPCQRKLCLERCFLFVGQPRRKRREGRHPHRSRCGESRASHCWCWPPPAQSSHLTTTLSACRRMLTRKW
jgi:hypothetical protein